MPHVSKKKLSKSVVRGLEKNLDHLVRNSGSQTRIIIFDEILTQTEKLMIAKRLAIILLLRKGYTPAQISGILGVSYSTAERFQYRLELGSFKRTADWVWKNSKDGQMDALLEALVALMFTGRVRSFKKYVEEL